MAKTVTVVQIANEAHVDPRTARQRLRRAIIANVFTRTPIKDTRWEFAAKDAAALRKVIAQ